MSKLLICLAMTLIILFSSVTHGADKTELNNKTVLSILNTVMEFYYAKYRGDMAKLQTLFLKKMSANEIRNYIGSAIAYNREKKVFRKIKVLDEEKMEFRELNVSLENPDTASVVVRVWYKKGISVPPYEDDLIILKKVEDQWKIVEFGPPGLP
ncbi:MAG: hypothetical protein JRD68_01180 [Deltaproteobacteria bacterium]|nr:hypothetical protein [Deltaproteobacteria bacterium]